MDKTKKVRIRDVAGYEDTYSVTDDGRVWSKPRKHTNGKALGGLWMKPASLGGYAILSFSKNSKRRMVRVHRLVAQAFIPNPGNRPEVNHINAKPGDNRVENLEWCTPKENMQHASRLQLMCGTQQWKSKLNEEKVKEIRQKYIPRVFTYKQLAKEYGVSDITINYVVRRLSWKHVP